MRTRRVLRLWFYDATRIAARTLACAGTSSKDAQRSAHVADAALDAANESGAYDHCVGKRAASADVRSGALPQPASAAAAAASVTHHAHRSRANACRME